MNKFFIYFVFVLIFLIILFYKEKKIDNFYYYKINNKIYKLLKAETSDQWQKGLMFYKNKKELKGADGMIFIFPDYNYRVFWNKNTYLDLDIYWLKDDKVVGKDYLPNILKTKNIFNVSSKEKVNKVIEIVKTKP
ncbi:MAG: DUF192 domain-containing protein [Patescibacteria group bacterium]|nr:DUF192 domain-containing protein [Patescibacteria group bacterium]